MTSATEAPAVTMSCKRERQLVGRTMCYVARVAETSWWGLCYVARVPVLAKRLREGIPEDTPRKAPHYSIAETCRSAGCPT